MRHGACESSEDLEERQLDMKEHWKRDWTDLGEGMEGLDFGAMAKIAGASEEKMQDPIVKMSFAQLLHAGQDIIYVRIRVLHRIITGHRAQVPNQTAASKAR